MIEELKELIEMEEIYVLSLEEASKSTENKAIIDRAEGIKIYYKRIKELIQKEIIDVYSTSND